MPLRIVVSVPLVAFAIALPLAADEPVTNEPREPSFAERLATFRAEWKAEDWTQRGGPYRQGYMWPLDNDGWKARFHVLRAAVRDPKAAVPELLASLESRNTEERIVAAQALGYVDAAVPREPLLAAARNDADPAVRLYAVDALGMLGHEVDWALLEKVERNRDVRKHIGYARERKRAKLDPDVRRTLARFDPKRLGTAEVGRLAPDFELRTVDGETVKLSSFRGKRAVVLVFVYGDT